jgi:Ca2+-transporting ATPase
MEHARSMAMLLMVMMQNLHVMNCRSETRSVFRMPFRDNPWLIFSILVAQGVHISAAYIPGLSGLLHLEPLTLKEWLILLPLAGSIIAVMEAYKWFAKSVSKANRMTLP